MNTDKTTKTLSLNKTKGKKPGKNTEAVRSGARAKNLALKSFSKKTAANKPDSNKAIKTERSQSSPAGYATKKTGPAKPGRLRDRLQADTPSTQKNPADINLFQVFAPCPSGLEQILATELGNLGYESIKTERAGCHFQSDWHGILKANLYSRIATRILVQVAQAEVNSEDDILELARTTAWEHWFGPKQKLRVDTSAVRSPMQSLQYCNLRVKDGICDRLRLKEGARPDIDTVRPDAKVHLFLNETSATLYLDVSGESLFKRGWRLDKGVAPLRENLAAGLLYLSGWDQQSALLDPFCGSGTILIEAAWMALNVPPGIWRPFGFERLRNHNPKFWHTLKDEARSNIKTRLEIPICGSDKDTSAIEAAQANMFRANLSTDAICFSSQDARNVLPPAAEGYIVCNPPYGERMDDVVLWQQWSSWLKEHYADWQINVITSDLDLPGQLRLRPKRKYPVYNGALDCRFFQFELVKGKYQ